MESSSGIDRGPNPKTKGKALCPNHVSSCFYVAHSRIGQKHKKTTCGVLGAKTGGL